MSNSPAFVFKPDPDHRFWMYSPEGDGLTYYSTETERDEAARQEIRMYLDCDDSWLEEVEDILCGVVTHTIAKVVTGTKPANYDQMTEDEKDEFWPHSEEFDEIVDYQLKKL